jgi:HEAT repeat protein
VTAPGPIARAAELAALGHRDSLTTDEITRLVAAGADDPDERVRAAAVAAIVRAAPGDAIGPWRIALADPSVAVRRRAAELAPGLDGGETVIVLLPLLRDRDVTVVESAAWALGEMGESTIKDGGVDALVDIVQHHRDALAREAAVAALGAIGDARGLPAILDACTDKPAVRRRAVLALASFEGAAVDAAIDTALTDRDWQVRQAAEDLQGD